MYCLCVVDDVNCGRMSQAMCYMMYAEMVMYQKDTSRYATALQYMQEIINDKNDYGIMDDFALRCNIINVNDGIIVTHNGGNLETEDADVLIKYLNEKLASQYPGILRNAGQSPPCVLLQ